MLLPSFVLHERKRISGKESWFVDAMNILGCVTVWHNHVKCLHTKVEEEEERQRKSIVMGVYIFFIGHTSGGNCKASVLWGLGG